MNQNGVDKINVRVLFFGAAREAAGTEVVLLTTGLPATVLTVKNEVFCRFQPLSRFAKSFMVSVNREYATDETVVNDHDEIAFLPPVSGG